MTTWIVAGLALFVAQTLIAPTLRYLSAGPGTLARLRIALGPRDVEPPLSEAGARAARALVNMHEALPVFLTLAILVELRPDAHPMGVHGAALWVAARTLYVPAYLSGRIGARSAVWVVSWLGLSAMLWALAR